jgi:hypothetical protein
VLGFRCRGSRQKSAAAHLTVAIKIMLQLIDFVFPRRLHRLAYFLRAMLTLIATDIVYSLSTTMNPRHFWITVIVLWIYSLLFIDLPRIRDVRMSGWWLLVGFAPLANLWLGLLANLCIGLILLFRAPCYDIEAEA